MDWQQNHRTIVCLRASEYEMTRMQGLGKRTASFVDEDLDDMLTAVAFEPMARSEGRTLFGGMRLA
jgi:hypothetical protein